MENRKKEDDNSDDNKGDNIWVITPELRKKYPQQSAFIDRIRPSVKKIYEESGIPWRFLIAQVCLESGYGKGEIVDIETGEYSKNLFGIKYFGDTKLRSKYVKTWTWEEIKTGELNAWKKSHPELILSGKTERGNYKIKIIGNFAKYDSYDNAFNGYKRVLLNSHFKHALRSKEDVLTP